MTTDRDDVPTCRICGCTDYSACVTGHPPKACHWVADELCSACAEAFDG